MSAGIMISILKTAAGSPENQDRGAIFDCGEHLVLVMADGAGGRSGGTEAAQMAVDLVRQDALSLHTPASCIGLLQRIDHAIAEDRVAGETTCVVTIVTDEQVYGASVGDSGVWLIRQGALTNLSDKQVRKPFIGSGSAFAVPFDHKWASGEQLLLATDGLLKYTSPDRILEICRRNSVEAAAQQLIELVRYSSGALPDDVTVILTQV
jgi:serine/threonine protein phosphatase PrpC